MLSRKETNEVGGYLNDLDPRLYRLDEMLARIIGKDAGMFIDLAAYSIIEEDNVGQYYLLER